MKWPVLRFIWESRGLKMETVSNALKAKWPKGGFSETNIQRFASETMEEVPAEVAALVLGLPAEPGFEHKAAIVEAGLKALEGAAIDPAELMTRFAKKLPGVDPEVIARAIVAQLRAEKLLGEDSAKLDGLIAELRALAASVDARAGQADKERAEDRAKLDELAAELRRMMLGLLFMFFHELRTMARRGFVALAILSLVVGAGVVACLYPRFSAVPGNSAHARGGGVMEAVAGGGFWKHVPFLGHYIAGETGEKAPPEMYIPDHPLEGQKRDHCNPKRGESLINGGCWAAMADVKPPCGELFRHGDKCYRPIAEDPTRPVGGDAEQRRREEAGMPGKEQEQ